MIELSDDNSLDVPAPDPMTPMIDVIFSLIAFMMLMINAPLLKMDMALPHTPPQSSASYADSKFVTLTILPTAAHYRLDDKALDEQQLSKALGLLQQNGNMKLMLKTDANTPVQRMVDTLNILNRLKISDAQIALDNGAK